MTHVEGIRRRGIKKYLKAFVTPGFMTTDESLRRVHQSPFTWRLRVFGNIFAGK